jgi:5S rRNA maturation endonuclease (ribonuclease M5)
MGSERFTCEAVARAVLGPPVKKAGSELLFPCPNHDDQHPSLNVNPRKDVWMCGPCRASGNAWQLAGFLAKVSPDDKPAVTAWLRQHGLLDGKREIVAVYEYQDAQGKAIGHVVRLTNPKDFYQERPNKKGGWIPGGFPPTLYNLPEVLKSKSVLICEGEKDCETARKLGLVATCNPGGAGKWRTEYADVLRGKRIATIADADGPGRKHAREVSRSLSGIAETVKSLELLRAKDLTEWVERGGTQEALLELLRSVPEWKPQDVNLSSLLDRLVSFTRRFVFMSESQASVVTLWTVHTHAFQAADTTPYLAVTSAEKRSGKTRLLEVLETLVASSWLTGRVTAAVLTRKVHADCPTLLLDESDAAFAGEKEYSEALRGILNTGHRRGGKASCCVGQGAAISFQDFSTFCPKAIAGIGKLPDTVDDRTIPVRLKRVMAGERVERFRHREIEGEAARLRDELEAWCWANVEKLREARPELPPELNDRQQDGAEPLLAIADAAGGMWPEEARRALVELCAEGQAGDDSIGKQALADIRQIFQERNTNRISSADLARALAEIETSPWGEWSHGKPLTQARLARLLKPYGIVPGTVRIGENTPKGYHLGDFLDPFKRYLSGEPDPLLFPASLAPPGPQNATPPQASIDAGPGHFSKRNTENFVAAKKPDKPNGMSDVADVAVSKGGEGLRGDDSDGKTAMVEFDV